jgi:hypoxanthine phosphoribosyltransferase
MPGSIWSALLAVIGSLSTLYGAYQLLTEEIRPRFTKKIITATMFFECANELCGKLRNKSITPDIFLGIGRGGSIVAGVLASSFRRQGQKRSCPIATADWRIDESGNKVVILPSGINLTDKTVILCVAEDWTGHLLRVAKEKALSRNPKVLWTLSLYSNNVPERGSLHDHPDFFPLPDFVGINRSKEQRLPWQTKR